MPPNTLSVCRPGRWGNWHIVGKIYDCRPIPQTSAEAVAQFRDDISAMLAEDYEKTMEWLSPLRGQNLACFCSLDQPCHADVLIEVSNDEGVRWEK
jgi:hypothetical protein